MVCDAAEPKPKTAKSAVNMGDLLPTPEGLDFIALRYGNAAGDSAQHLPNVQLCSETTARPAAPAKAFTPSATTAPEIKSADARTTNAVSYPFGFGLDESSSLTGITGDIAKDPTVQKEMAFGAALAALPLVGAIGAEAPEGFAAAQRLIGGLGRAFRAIRQFENPGAKPEETTPEPPSETKTPNEPNAPPEAAEPEPLPKNFKLDSQGRLSNIKLGGSKEVQFGYSGNSGPNGEPNSINVYDGSYRPSQTYRNTGQVDESTGEPIWVDRTGERVNINFQRANPGEPINGVSIKDPETLPYGGKTTYSTDGTQFEGQDRLAGYKVKLDSNGQLTEWQAPPTPENPNGWSARITPGEPGEPQEVRITGKGYEEIFRRAPDGSYDASISGSLGTTGDGPPVELPIPQRFSSIRFTRVGNGEMEYSLEFRPEDWNNPIQVMHPTGDLETVSSPPQVTIP